MAATREYLNFLVTVSTESLKASVRAASGEVDKFAAKTKKGLADAFSGFGKGLDTGKARAAVRELDGDVSNFGKNAKASLSGVQSAFAGLAAAFAGLHLFGGAIAEFAQFDDAMLKVQALSGATAGELDALKRQASELGATTRFSAADAAAAMQQLAAAGQTVDQIQASMQAAMDIAAISMMDVGEAADQLTNIMSQFGIEAENSSQVADILTAGFTGAATSMTQLAEAMTYVGPVANAVGYSLGDTTAVLMALANNGYKASMAGTALRGGISRLLNPSAEATKILKNYSIEVLNADGSMRNFADIIEDLGNTAITEAEMLEIFGDRAGPAMLALLKQGADAIREYGKRVEESGGLARRTAEHMEEGLGGALRRLSAATSELRKSFGEALAPAVSALADAFAGLAGWFTQLPEWQRSIVAWGVAFTALATVLPAVVAAFKMLIAFMGPGVQGIVAFRAGVGQASAAIQGLAGACLAGKVALGGLAVAAGLGLVKIVELAKVLWDCKRASDEVAASQQRGEEYRKRQAEQLARISEATGVTIKSFQDLMKAERDGKIHYDQLTQSWKKGAAEKASAEQQAMQTVKKVTGEALEEMAEKYRAYADEIKRIQEDLSGRQKSLAAELREMGRTGMSDQDAWADRRREAEEYVAAAKRAAEEAQKLWDNGNTVIAAAKWQEAVAFADDAKAAYRALNTEVKEGDQTIISKAEALKTAMQGVREAGELGMDILQRQQDTIYKTMDKLEESSGFAGLISHLDEAQRAWLEVYQKAQDAGVESVEAVSQKIVAQQKEIQVVEAAWASAAKSTKGLWIQLADDLQKKLDAATKPRTVTVYTNVVQGKRWGGLIGDALRFATGGKLPGYGGGDKVPAMLEPGEFVVRKEAVKKFGVGFLDAINTLNLSKLIDLSAALPRIAPMPSIAAATPMGHMVLELKLPGGDSVTATVSKEDAETLARHNRWVSNLRFRR